MRIALVLGPLVGPTTWTGVASLLRHAGDQVVVPDLRVALAPSSGDAERPGRNCRSDQSMCWSLVTKPDRD
jgi:hypothetical protein